MKPLQEAAATLGWGNKRLGLELLRFRSLEKGLHGAEAHLSEKGHRLAGASVSVGGRVAPRDWPVDAWGGGPPAGVDIWGCCNSVLQVLEKLAWQTIAAVDRGLAARITLVGRKRKKTSQKDEVISSFWILVILFQHPYGQLARQRWGFQSQSQHHQAELGLTQSAVFNLKCLSRFTGGKVCYWLILFSYLSTAKSYTLHKYGQPLLLHYRLFNQGSAQYNAHSRCIINYIAKMMSGRYEYRFPC